MSLADNYQEKWANERAVSAHQTEHDEVLTGLDRVQRAVLQGHQANIAALATIEPNVTVKNQIDAATPKDINKVVATIQDLIAVQKKQKPTDLAPLVKAVNQLVPLLRNLPKQIDIPDNDTVEVTNLGELRVVLEDILLSLRAANEREAAEAEKTITVTAPDVVIQEREFDLSPITAAQDRIVEAINASKVVIPPDDDTEILTALAEVKDTIANLRFPIPNVPTDPLIRYKTADVEEVDGTGNPLTVKYYGMITNDGGWMIMRDDSTSTPRQIRYAGGFRDYPDAWTSRATLTYGYLYNAVNG